MTLNKNFFVGLLVGLSIFALFAFKGNDSKVVNEVQKWEYKTELGFKKINELGKEGWELVAVDGLNGYFKRPIN